MNSLYCVKIYVYCIAINIDIEQCSQIFSSKLEIVIREKLKERYVKNVGVWLYFPVFNEYYIKYKIKRRK